jgi:hypothetical protein
VNWQTLFHAQEQRFRARILPHHDQRTSENGDPTEHGKEITPPFTNNNPKRTLLLNRPLPQLVFCFGFEMPPMTHDFSHVFIELGLAVVGLAVLARLANRWGFSAMPLYLLAGLAFGNGGLAPLQLTENFIHIGAEINFFPATEAKIGEFQGVRSFAEQILHVAEVNIVLSAAILGEKPPVEADFAGHNPETVKTRSAVLKHLKASFT